MVQYKITERGELRKVAKNLKEVSDIVGVTTRTLIKRFKDNNRITHDNLIIEKGTTNIKKVQNLKVGVKQTRGDFNNNIQFEGRERVLKKDDNPVVISNESTAMNLIRAIQDVRPAMNLLRTRKFSVFFTFETEDGGIDQASTKYLPWNDMMDELDDRITNWYGSYGASLLKSFELRWIDAGPLPQQIIYGGMKDLMIEFYKKITGKEETKKLFFNFIKKHKIGHRTTYKNCFIYCVIHGLFQTEDEDLVEGKFNTIKHHFKFGEEPRQQEYLGKLLSEYYNTQIWVYDDELKLTTKYGKEHDKIVKIMIYANHAFYIIDKAGEETFYKIDEELNEQVPMTPNEEKEDNTIYIYGAYDAETYNVITDKNDKGCKGDTKAFAYGYITERTKYKSVFAKKGEEGKDAGNTTLDFINGLQKLPRKKGRKTKYILYAHNGGKFDSYDVLYTLLKNNFSIKEFMPKDGRIIHLEIYGKKIKEGEGSLSIVLRDSMCLLAGSLDDLLDKFKCDTKKLTGTVDYKCVNENNCYTDKIINHFYQYLENDVVGLHELIGKVKNIVKEFYDIDLHRCRTNASVARNYFFNEHDFDETPIYTIPMDTYKELKPFYLGGRNEAFTMGIIKEKDGFFYYDFTSLYPFVMHKYKLPYGEFEHIKLNNTTTFNKKWFGMVKVRIKSNSTDFKPYYGIKQDGKLLFKHFKDYTEIITTTPHIKNAIRLGLDYSYEFVEIWNYDNKGRYFRDIIEQCYDLKTKAEQDGNDPLRQMAKIIINSLYGFWGIKFDKVEQADIKKFKNKDIKKHHIVKHLNRNRLKDYKDIGKSTIIYTEEELKINGANIGLAMFITDYARQELYNLMTDIEKIGGKCHYADTDSVVCNIRLEDTPLNEKYTIKVKGEKPGLGDLTNETDIRGGFYDELVVLGCKSYYLKCSEETFKKLEPGAIKGLKKGIEKAKTDHKRKELESKLKNLSSHTYDEMKFKGVNIKAKYDIKVYDHEKKTITLKGINKESGKYKVDPSDYELMANDYKLNTDNFSFISSVKNLDKRQNLLYIENVKTVKKQYHKANVNDKGECVPFYN